MSSANPDIAAIDAALARGEWWQKVLEELAEAGVQLASAIADEVKAGRRSAVEAADDFARIAAAVRQAVAMSFRLDEAMHGLTALRGCAAHEIAAARIRAEAEAAERAARLDAAKQRARARREARREKIRELVMQVIDREAADAKDHERLSLDLDTRLGFGPVWTDIDRLPLRRTVQRLCAALRIAPDWSRWKAGIWNPPEPPSRPDEPPVQRSGETPPGEPAQRTRAADRPPGTARLE